MRSPGRLREGTPLDTKLKAENAPVHERVMVEKTGLFGAYKAVDEAKLKVATPEEQKIIKDATGVVKQANLQKVAIFPLLMFLAYLSMLLYFRSIGGYRPVRLKELQGEVHTGTDLGTAES